MAEEQVAETKPKVEGNAFQLIVKDQSGGEVHFKVKPHTKFDKIMQHYASNKAVGVNNLRFLFEGRRLQPTDTPSDLGLEADDVIDAVIEQTGGRGARAQPPLSRC